MHSPSRLSPLWLALWASLFLVPAHGQQQAEGAKTVRTYDLRALSVPRCDPERELAKPWGIPLPWPGLAVTPGCGSDRPVESAFAPSELLAADGPMTVVESLFTELLKGGPDFSGEDVQIDRGSVRLRTSQRMAAAADALAESVRQLGSCRVRCQWLWLPADATADLARAVLSEPETEALLKAHAPTKALVGVITRCQPAWLAAQQLCEYVRDQDLEVNEKARVFDPKKDVLRLGPRAWISVLGSPQGRWLVHFAGADARLAGPLRLRDVGGGSFVAKVQLPRVDVAFGSAFARVEDGGAIVVTPGDARAGVWLVRFKAALGFKLPASSDYDLVDLGELATVEPRRRDVEREPVVAPGTAHETEAEVPADDESRTCRLERLRATNASLAKALDQQRVAQYADHLLVCGSPEQRRGLLAALQEASPPRDNVQVELRWGVVPAARTVPIALGKVTPEALAKELPEQALSTTRTGELIRLAQKQECSYLKDYDVEIAKEATGPNPVIDTYWTGLVLQARPRRGEQGRILLSADLSFAKAIGEENVVALGAENTKDLDAPAVAVTHTAATLSVVPGEWTLLHAAPLTGSDQAIVVVIRLR